jgi:hypothetical protein
MAQARKYIADTMGDKYADGVILDLEKMWYESTARSPMVCLLSLGSRIISLYNMYSENCLLPSKYDLLRQVVSKKRFILHS